MVNGDRVTICDLSVSGRMSEQPSYSQDNQEYSLGESEAEAVELLKRFEPLSTLSDSHLREVLPHVEQMEVEQGRMLFKRGQACKSYYYLLEGSLDLLDSQYQVTPLLSDDKRVLQPLDNNDPYLFSAVTTSAARILKVSKDRLDLVLTWNQAGNYLVEEFDEDSSAALDSDWMSCLLGSPIFQQVPPANLQQLFVKFREVNVAAGTAVINEGDPGSDFYVIKSGMADVIKTKEGVREKVATLGPGQYFGEEALIGDTVRNASVVMSKSGTLMKLGKVDFKLLLEQPVVTFISYQELKEWQTSGENVSFLDIRLPVEIPQHERENRLIVPLPNLRSRLNILDQETLYVINSDGGERRATLGAYLLSQAGYRAVVLEQGMVEGG